MTESAGGESKNVLWLLGVPLVLFLLLGTAWTVGGLDFLWDDEPDTALAAGAHSPGAPPLKSTGANLTNVVGPNTTPFDEFSAIASRIESSTNPYMGVGSMPRLKAQLANPSLPLEQRLSARAALVTEHLRFGEVDEAIAQMDTAIKEVEAVSSLSAGTSGLVRLRALSYLRKAEVQNCVQRHNRDCCIFPLQGGAIHSVREPAELAKQDLLKYLELMPPIPGNPRRAERVLSAVWLLNITCMALGEYPDGVPAQFRIPSERFASEADIGRFVDVAGELGVDVFDHAGGAIADDFDNDGLIDLVSSSCGLREGIRAFRNNGDGSFADVSSAWGVDTQLGALNLVPTDYNNDGRLDIFVPRGAWLFSDGEMRNSLLRANSDGSFTDVTYQAGIVEPIGPSQAAVWADFDNDGWLDLYVGHESQTELRADGKRYPNALYRNNGDGTFTDVTMKAGVSNERYCKGLAAGDFDNDGDMDIYVSNVGANRLYRNNGDMTFTDVALKARVAEPVQRSFGTWFFDFDNDGWLDIWVAGYQATIADLAAEAFGAPHEVIYPRLYRNNGDGTFTDVAQQTGLQRVFLPMGANFGDFDNDGWLDMYLGTGDPSYEALMPNVALRNDGGRKFQDITQSAGLGHLQKGHGVAFADIDNDGDQDLFHQLGAFYPGDGFRNALFMNPGHGNRFITIELEGVKTNRMAVGARLKIVIDTPNGQREIHRAPGCISSFGGSPRRQEIGLGEATAIKSIEIWWPTTGERQTFTNVPMDSFIRITEGEEQFEMLQPVKLKLGAS